MTYTMEELISMLEEVVRHATPVPISKKSMVDVSQIDEITENMRLSLPTEIQKARNVVAEQNNILNNAKKQAKEIVAQAEQQRKQILDQNSIMAEARQRATEAIADAQSRSNALRNSTNEFTDKMLSRVEELMLKDINDLRMLRKTLSGQQAASAVQGKSQPKPPQVPQDPTK